MPSTSFSSAKPQSTSSLSTAAKDLFRVIYQAQQPREDSGESDSKIRVNEIISKMSFFYEKIRNAVDYKDEHLLRKNAIERILKRMILMGNQEPEEMSKTLIIELIRAGYLDNNQIPERKIGEIALIIERFFKLHKLILAAGKKEKEESDKIKHWITNLAATNIEENLGSHSINQVIGKHMFELVNRDIVDDGSNEEFSRDKKIQIYVAIYSKLFNYDDSMLEFLLFRFFNSDWYKASDNDIVRISQRYHELMEVSSQQISHPFRKQVQKITARYNVYFSVLRDAIEENPEGAYDKLKREPGQFKKLIEKKCEKRYKESRGKLRRGATRSIVYIFLTKTILVFILEAPAIIWLGGELVYYSLLINVLFPPALLFFIVMFTSVPGKNNTGLINNGVAKIVFDQEGNNGKTRLYYPVARGLITNTAFGIFYAVTFLLSFGLVIWGLIYIHFNIISIIIFTFFLSLISFFGIRLGRIAKAYSVEDRRENIFSFIANFFYIPIISMGKWLSETFSQINVFIFVLDFIIEAPFKIFVEVAEQWTAYVRERKEGIVE